MEQVGTGTRTSWLTLKVLAFLAVGLLFFGWLMYTPGGLLGKADAVGYAVCHRIDLRSFHLGDRQLPLCARCTGMYTGAMLALGYQAARGRRRAGMPNRKVLAALGFLALAFAVDGINSYLHLFPGLPGLYEPQNWLRLLTGTGMGMAAASILYPAFNQSVWADWDPQPAFENFRSLLGLLALGGLLDLLILSENPLALYPLALISATGVLVLLTMVYTMTWLLVLRKENRFLSLRQLALPLVGGFGVGILQIFLIDAARFIVTGTWGGFPIG